MANLIKIAAPRKQAYDPMDPGSLIIFTERDRRHPANDAYHLPAGELVLQEGDGIEGDPARSNNPKGSPPLEAYPTPAINAAILAGRLVQVKPDTNMAELQLTESSMGSLTSLTKRQADALVESLRLESVEHLADKMGAAANPVEVLTRVRGIGPRAAEDLLNELEARGLIEGVD